MGDLRSIGRLLSAGALVVVLGGCSPLDTAIQGIFGRSMRNTPSIKAYEDPRLPAEGTVPFAAGNFAPPGEFNVGQAEAYSGVPAPITQSDLNVANPSAAVMELANPIPATAASLARGEQVYLRACAPCHGPTGDGVGYMVETGAYPLQFSLVADHVKAFPDGYLYGIIRVGRGLMPAYGHQVTHQDRWHIVNYVRQLQGAAAPGDE